MASVEFVAVNENIVPVAEATLPATAQGARYGSGCFETIALVDAQPRFWPLHWRRFEASCRKLHMQLRISEGRVLELIDNLVQRNGVGSDGVVRLSAHGNGAFADTVLCVNPPRRKELPSSFTLGVSQIRHPGAGPLSGIKHNNYGLFLAAFEQGAQPYGLDDVAMAGERGEVLEGSRTNLFFILHGTHGGLSAKADVAAKADESAKVDEPAKAATPAEEANALPKATQAKDISTAQFVEQSSVQAAALAAAFDGLTVVTAPLSSGVLPGVMREVVLQVAAASSLELRLEALLPQQIDSEAVACFATNALIGVMPVVALGERRFDMAHPAYRAVELLRTVVQGLR